MKDVDIVLIVGALALGAIVLFEITNKDTRFIYKTTDRIIPGHEFKSHGTSFNHTMESTHSRPSTRYIWFEDTGKKHKLGCVPFFNKEFTAYVTIGKVFDNASGIILTSGGGPQSNTEDNCCVYSIGFYTDGRPFVGEEGSHKNKHAHITDNLYYTTNTLKSIKSIGSLENRTIGIKFVQYIDMMGNSILEGYVDKHDSGKWQKFYKGVNVSGVYRHGRGVAPVITHVGMTGSKCQEARIRGDSAWPVTFDPNRTSVAEILVN